MKTGMLIFSIVFICISCASISKENISFQPIDHPETQQILKPIKLSLDTGYVRTIDANTEWKLIGTVSNHTFTDGKVYKPVKNIFTIEGTQRYEAYIVVADGKIIGFYLPASSMFSPLKSKVEFP